MNNVAQVRRLTDILTKMHNILRIIFQRYGTPSVPDALKGRSVKSDLPISEKTLIDHELEQIYIVRDTGERYFTRQEAELSIRRRHEKRT